MRHTASMAKTVPVGEFRNHLSTLPSDVADCRDHVPVTRNGKPAAALVPIDGYDALDLSSAGPSSTPYRTCSAYTNAIRWPATCCAGA